MVDNGSITNRMKRSGSGCAIYFVVFLGLAYGLDRFTAPHLIAEARPWVGIVAAVFLTLAVGSFWGLLTGYTRGGGSAALLASAQTSGLPDKDGPLLATGTVRLDAAFGEPLIAPLSGTPCAAYLYRMYYITSNVTERRKEVPVYWGSACVPFRIESAARSVRVAAVPLLNDAATKMEMESHMARAREYIANTRFELASGMAGAIGTAFAIVNVVLGEENKHYRRDWASKDQPVDPSTLRLEETVLAIGAAASVVGPWSASRRAIVPHIDGWDALSVSATAGPVKEMRVDGVGVPPSTLAGTVTAFGLLAIAAGILWGAITILGGKP